MENFSQLFVEKVKIGGNLVILDSNVQYENQKQTADVFSKKWASYEATEDKEKLYQMQKEWYLKLYGFKSELAFAEYLSGKKFIYDVGCGLGYKAAWFASLAPNSQVVAMDISDAIYIAAENYQSFPNLLFVKGDIAQSHFVENSFDYVSCDQVIMHTQSPDKTFAELARVTKQNCDFACYVYAKKALPRELLDDYFREQCKKYSHEEIFQLSQQLTQLGKILSDLNIDIRVPEIPLLGIKTGTYNLQRFIYWNFLKCYWNEELGYETSVHVNYDWYSPANAKRYSEDEFLELIKENHLNITFFHKEEACYSGRFMKVE